MALALGPIPLHLKTIVGRWIEEGRHGDPPKTDERLGALFIYGGPGGCCYLDAAGEIWSWDAWNDVVTRLPDGPTKVGLIAIAAEHRPELAAWLPRCPEEAVVCDRCEGSGWWLTPRPRLQCPQCVGLGWVVEMASGTEPANGS